MLSLFGSVVETPSATASSDSIMQNYADSLMVLVSRQSTSVSRSATAPNPYLFRLLGPGTLFTSALSQQMGTTTTNTQRTTLPSLGSTTDRQLLLSEASNAQLAYAYAHQPQLFSATQVELDESGGIRSDLNQPVVVERKLAEKIVEELPDVQVEAVEPEVKRPNFWTFSGNGGMQFTQNYYSKNWYKGGQNNYSLLTMLTAYAKFNNQRKVQWDNTFEGKFGFQTNDDADPKLRPIGNLLRLTSNLNIKAIGHWNYAAQIQLESQPYHSYRGNTNFVNTTFLAPLYVRSSIGMDFNISKKRFTGKLHLAPLSYVITYARVDSIAQNTFGMTPGHNARHNWGPNIEFSFDYKITKDISWHSRLYWFSNLHSTRIENDHTFNFAINKYLSAKVYLYPRYEDTKYYNVKKDAEGNLTEDSARETHWMFSEILSLGLNYDF